MYEDTFGTDWEHIERRDEAIRRAYALGVATRLGAEHPGELERLNAETETTYDRSFVELAYQKGRDEAADATADSVGAIWEQLVDGKDIIAPFDRDEDDESDESTDRSLVDALGLIDIDTLPDDTTERVRRPSMFDRDPDPHPAARPGEERTVFGRPVSDVRQSTDATSTDSSDDDAGDADGDGADANATDTGSGTDDHSSADGSTGSTTSPSDSSGSDTNGSRRGE